MVRAAKSVTKHRQKESIFLTREEGLQLLDEQARRYLGMSGQEFVRAWDAGEIEDPDRPEVIRVLMLLPLAW